MITPPLDPLPNVGSSPATPSDPDFLPFNLNDGSVDPQLGGAPTHLGRQLPPGSGSPHPSKRSSIDLPAHIPNSYNPVHRMPDRRSSLLQASTGFDLDRYQQDDGPTKTPAKVLPISNDHQPITGRPAQYSCQSKEVSSGYDATSFQRHWETPVSSPSVPRSSESDHKPLNTQNALSPTTETSSTETKTHNTMKTIEWEDDPQDSLFSLPVPSQWPAQRTRPTALAYPTQEHVNRAQEDLARAIANTLTDVASAESLYDTISVQARQVHLYVPTLGRPIPMIFDDPENPKFTEVQKNNLSFSTYIGVAIQNRITVLNKEARISLETSISNSALFRDTMKSGLAFFEEHIVPRLNSLHSRFFMIHAMEAECTHLLGKNGVGKAAHSSFWLSFWTKVAERTLARVGNNSSLQNIDTTYALKLVFLADSVALTQTEQDRRLLHHKTGHAALTEVRKQVWSRSTESFATFKNSFALRLKAIKGTDNITDDMLAQEISSCIINCADYDRIYKDAAHKNLLTPQGYITAEVFDHALNLDPEYSKFASSVATLTPRYLLPLPSNSSSSRKTANRAAAVSAPSIYPSHSTYVKQSQPVMAATGATSAFSENKDRAYTARARGKGIKSSLPSTINSNSAANAVGCNLPVMQYGSRGDPAPTGTPHSPTGHEGPLTVRLDNIHPSRRLGAGSAPTDPYRAVAQSKYKPDIKPVHQ